jgi:vanillate O-demethylase monooxygenase subunit
MPAGSDPAWGRNSGDTLDVECHYLYVTDNLLDPSHVAWVHQSSIADTASANVPVDIHANANGSGLAVTRWTRAVEVPCRPSTASSPNFPATAIGCNTTRCVTPASP